MKDNLNCPNMRKFRLPGNQRFPINNVKGKPVQVDYVGMFPNGRVILVYVSGETKESSYNKKDINLYLSYKWWEEV
jgi:hypothetical protein